MPKVRRQSLPPANIRLAAVMRQFDRVTMKTLVRSKSKSPSNRARVGRVGARKSLTNAVAAAAGRGLTGSAAFSATDEDAALVNAVARAAARSLVS